MTNQHSDGGKIAVTSREYTRITSAASRAASQELSNVVDIRDRMTPLKFFNREVRKGGSLSHLRGNRRSVLRELSLIGAKSNGIATVRKATLADRLGISKVTVTRCLRDLEAEGLISRKKTRTKTGRQGADLIAFSSFRDYLEGKAPECQKAEKTPVQNPAKKVEPEYQSEGVQSITKTPLHIDMVRTIERTTQPVVRTPQAGHRLTAHLPSQTNIIPFEQRLQVIDLAGEESCIETLYQQYAAMGGALCLAN